MKVDGGNNAEFIFYAKNQHPYRLRIFDRWGNLLCDREYISNISGWNGRVDGEPVSLGVYVYQIECLDLSISGDVTIIE